MHLRGISVIPRLVMHSSLKIRRTSPGVVGASDYDAINLPGPLAGNGPGHLHTLGARQFLYSFLTDISLFGKVVGFQRG